MEGGGGFQKGKLRDGDVRLFPVGGVLADLNRDAGVVKGNNHSDLKLGREGGWP